jgi:tetratricopeptide (TPR) repeat protein/class 3 adenylate cyclase
MADLTKMNRTWLCSVVFMDIVNYSSQSVELQLKWKARFNGYLASAMNDVPEDERVILDTGDGAAICFLGAPEAAMFAALDLWHSLLLDEREQQPQLRVRIGINLGPVKLVRDINGFPNALGDGMNDGQRVMSFAAENQILVSQSFFEVVSRLSDDYKTLFTLKGVEKDKHVREHTVYDLSPPGAEHSQVSFLPQQAMSAAAVASHQPSAPPPAASPERVAQTAPESRAQNQARAGSRSILLLVGGIAFAVLAAAGAWYLFGPGARSNPTSPSAAPSAAAQPTPSPAPPTAAPPTAPAPTAPAPTQQAEPAPVARVPKKSPLPPPPAPSSSTTAGTDPYAAYGKGMQLIDEENAAQAVLSFDEAIRAQPDFVDAYVGRAEARRMLVQYELSLEDCEKIIKLQPDEPRGYNCRGLGRQLLKQYDASLRDFNEALRRNPKFAMAYGNLGTTYNLLQQHDRAIQDFNEAIRLAPKNPVFHIKRGNAYSDLKQYDKAIRDYTEAIRLNPEKMNGYRLRALAEEASGDVAGAAADRARMREARKAKNK